MTLTDKIPTTLRKLRQWIVWKTVQRADRPTKQPFTVNGAPASTADPATWSSFEEAVEHISEFSGLGFVFSPEDRLTGIDFDGCRDKTTGEIAQWAAWWIRKLDSYSEVSPGREGVKVWVEGKLPFEAGKKASLVQHSSPGGKEAGVEVYDHGRFFAVTGMRLAGLPAEPRERQDVLDDLRNEFFSQEAKTQDAAARQSSRLAVIERARRYLGTVPGAVSGQSGHNQTFKVACILVLGFSLTETEALILLSEYNQRCEPPWSEKELRHKIKSAAKQPGERGYLRDKNAKQLETALIPDYLEQKARDQSNKSELTTLHAATNAYLSLIEKNTVTLISTGISNLDYALGGGLEAGEFVVAAARPSHGKSAFALQCLHHIASTGFPVGIISEEMSSIALGKRTVQFVTATAEEDWRSNMVSVKSDVDCHFAARAPCYVIEGCGTSERAAEAIRQLAKEKGVRFVAVDYAQLLGSPGKSRYEQITKTSITLKQVTKTEGVTLLVLCQLSRAIEGRDKFIPRNDDIKESGQLEQDAGVILHLVWPHRLDSHKDPSEYQIWVGKNKMRPINLAEVDCRFDPSRQTISVSRSSGSIVYKPNFKHRLAD